ncbi:MAG: hypothetical protein IJU23_11315 [Proteobacteria bacterium]|nr:hypothetical protein [Pseudomonadota bacterium]
MSIGFASVRGYFIRRALAVLLQAIRTAFFFAVVRGVAGFVWGGMSWGGCKKTLLFHVKTDYTRRSVLYVSNVKTVRLGAGLLVCEQFRVAFMQQEIPCMGNKFHRESIYSGGVPRFEEKFPYFFQELEKDVSKCEGKSSFYRHGSRRLHRYDWVQDSAS